MQEALKPFLRDFKRCLHESRFRNDIVSVVLLGSGARGDWIRGESDIDFIVVVKDRRMKRPVAAFLWKLVKKLDRKHKLRLNLSDKTYNSILLNAIMKVEAFFLQRVPLYVLAEEEFDLVNRKIREPRIWFIATVIGSLPQFLLNLKHTGKTMYGKDLLKDIRVSFGLLDELKIILIPYYYLGLAALLLPFSPKQAAQHAIKACLLETDDELLLLHRKLGSYRRDEQLYERLFRGSPTIQHIRKCLRYRRMLSRKIIGYEEATEFVLDSARFVARSRIMVCRP
ncbi:MAG: nucleotidyltransferase domain-containing protein [Candidatus Aenigmarchaeota archaeon]|nr:nucleotidyltransferase domain-containing protein [Candidatus Aenigmarchaeota archaeon]